MGIESQIIQMVESKILTQGAREFLIKSNSKFSGIKVSAFEKAVCEKLKQGVTLSQLIHSLLKIDEPQKFQKLYGFLKSLCTEKFIINKDFVEFINLSSVGMANFEANPKVFSIGNSIKKLKDRLGKSGVNSHAQMILNDDDRSFTDRFLNLPFIRNLPDDAKEVILQKAKKIKVPNGETLIREGEATRHMLVVVEGCLGVYRYSPERKKHCLVTVMQEGSVVGESGFFLNQKRTASVLSIGECKVVKIDYTPGLVKAQPGEDQAKQFQMRVWYLQAIASSQYFKFLPTEAFDQFLTLGEFKWLGPSEVLYREGAQANSLAVVVQGELEAIGDGQSLNTMKSGDIVGEVGVLKSTGKRSVKVRAVTKALICEIERDQLWKFLSHNFILAVEFEKLANQRLKNHSGRG